MSSDSIFEVKGLTKEFDGLKAVDDLYFSLKRGAITALVGPNGAGKTTVFNIISGLLSANKGTVFFKGHNLCSMPLHKIAQLGIARTFQNIRLFPQISVLENILLALNFNRGESLSVALLNPKLWQQEEMVNRAAALQYLELVGLTEKREALAQNLSHGQRRLLEIARALATDAELFLFDEPAAGVFPETRQKIMEIFFNLKLLNKTTLFIEHDMKVVTGIADEVIVLNYGKKIASGSPDIVMKNEDVIEAYLGRRFRNNADS